MLYPHQVNCAGHKLQLSLKATLATTLHIHNRSVSTMVYCVCEAPQDIVKKQHVNVQQISCQVK